MTQWNTLLPENPLLAEVVKMDSLDSDSESNESSPDGVKKRINKLINRFKQATRISSQQDGIRKQRVLTKEENLLDYVYNFDHPKRGIAIFIINSTFDTQPRRPFADQDCKKMMELFSMLDFEIKLLENKGSANLWTNLLDINSQIESDCDCLACVISTHGAEVPISSTTDTKGDHRSHILFTKDGIIPTNKIMEAFNDDHCPNLQGKPRMFFIQACRSVWGSKDEENEIDQGFTFDLVYEQVKNENVPVKIKKTKRTLFGFGNTKRSNDVSVADTHGRPEDGRYIKHSDFKPADPVDFCDIPCFEDYLVMFSSASERIAWSDCGKGGWLTYCLYEVFKKLLDTDYSISLLQILADVCGQMSKDMVTNTPSKPVYHHSKSAATIYHMLTKDIYLKPVVHKVKCIQNPGPVLETAV